MIATEDPHLAQTAKHLTTQAKVPGSGYNHDTVGYNYRMNALAAAFGVAQLEKLAETVRAKRSVAAHYDCLLEGASAIHAAPVQNWAYATHWLYSVFFGDLSVDLDGVVQSLLGVGIETRRIWPPLHRQRPYSKTPRLAGDVAEDIYRRVLSLPSSPHLTGTDQERVVMHLERYIETNRLE
jgi:dTDP-4-amino-4,6-dideoxygalactose transaminase